MEKCELAISAMPFFYENSFFSLHYLQSRRLQCCGICCVLKDVHRGVSRRCRFAALPGNVTRDDSSVGLPKRAGSHMYCAALLMFFDCVLSLSEQGCNAC